ncbi:MAG: NUDIX hydrolase [Actinobacteria bacterium]|nr:NUDIX hydrolase [Actinomycetota bacterium]
MTAVPRDAATVILMRGSEGGKGIEVLMVRRSGSSDFAAGMHVFPGGGVEEGDCRREVAALCAGLGPEEAASILGDVSDPSLCLGIFVAAVRETFEETGILMARDASGNLVDCRGEAAGRYAAYREALKEGRIGFTEMIAREGIELALDRLVYFAHWITPEVSPIRFDTRFFLAAAPPCQVAAHDEIETTDHVWISPEEALKKNREGTFAMLPPTMVNLMALERFSSVDEALAYAAGREVPTISPRVVVEGGRMRLVLPGDPDYE